MILTSQNTAQPDFGLALHLQHARNCNPCPSPYARPTPATDEAIPLAQDYTTRHADRYRHACRDCSTVTATIPVKRQAVIVTVFRRFVAAQLHNFFFLFFRPKFKLGEGQPLSPCAATARNGTSVWSPPLPGLDRKAQKQNGKDLQSIRKLFIGYFTSTPVQ